MRRHHFPPICEKCAAMPAHPDTQGATMGMCDRMPWNPPHDELEKIALAGHIELSILLYHCRRCDSWWEFTDSSYHPSDQSTRQRIPPVPSPDIWREQQQQAMKPYPECIRVLLASIAALVAGMVILGGIAGIAWLVATLFSRDSAEFAMFAILIGVALCLYINTQEKK